MPVGRAFRNVYFALRHGRSLANEQGIIVARPERGCAGFGLSAAGRAEAEERLSPGCIAAAGLAARSAICYTSDFLRAVETAEILCRANGLAPAIVDVRLRERDFGALEGAPSGEGYEAIWRRDRESEDHGEAGCEGTARVRARLEALLADLEARHGGRHIVLVSHGDPLQILETIFAGVPSNRHRELPQLETGELRRLGRPQT